MAARMNGPQVQAVPVTRTEFRIESRRPGVRKWEYITATYTTAGTLDTAEAHLRWHQEHSPGWAFRIASRIVTVSSTPWAPVSEVEV